MSKTFVFDPAVINEQACRDHAVLGIRNGADRMEIHKHAYDESCIGKVVDLVNGRQLYDLPDDMCYAFTSDTDLVNWVSHNT